MVTSVSFEPLDGLSIDVEDYYQVEAFADRITPAMWPALPSRVADNTSRVLDLLGRFGATATFFVVGWIAERQPQIVRKILSAGHELACHSHLHRRVSRLSPEEFREDTRRALAAIEDAAGKKVRGYRAPTFSIVPSCLWALEILAEEGFVYDSSVFPIRHDLYGMPKAPRFPFRWQLGNETFIYEIPLTTVQVWRFNLPVGGGGYLRILPMFYTRWAMRQIRQRDCQPAQTYFHPWEIDPGQPRLPGTIKSKFRHYYNLKRMEARLSELLSHGHFVPLGELLKSRIALGPLPLQKLIPSAAQAAEHLDSLRPIRDQYKY